MKPFLRTLPRPAAIAHRGGAKQWPENTLLAFGNALQLGMDVLELDVHSTQDGVLVVAHDATVDRCTDGAGPISALTLAQLQRLDAAAHFEGHAGTGLRIPTLDQVLQAFPQARLNIELKHAGPESELLELLQRRDALERVCLGSEHDSVAERLAELRPQVCRFYPAGAALRLAMSVWGADELEPDPRYDVLEIPRVYEGEVVATAALFSACSSVGVPVLVWVVDEPEHIRSLVKEGAAGVMTDLPAVLASVWAR